MIKIGEQYINLDNATIVYDYLEYKPNPTNKIVVEFIGCADEDHGRAIFEKDEADALRWYLNGKSIDILRRWQRREA